MEHPASSLPDGWKPRLSGFIVTLNEEINLEPCLASLQSCVDDLYVVDSGSTDATVQIAERYGCQVVVHAFAGHSPQRNWALRNLPFRHDWVLALDADQRATPELAQELRERFRDPPADTAGLFVKRRQVWRGEWIRHGGYYPKWQLKLFRHAVTSCDEEEFDHHFYVDGPIGHLRQDIVEENKKEDDIGFWIAKHNRYAEEWAREEYRRRATRKGWRIEPRLFGHPDQRVLWFKRRWYRLPLYLRPFLYFGYRYVLQRGFLDGKQGQLFHFLQGFWFRMLVDMRLDDLLKERRLGS